MAFKRFSQDKRDVTIVFFYSIGRSGTAYLYQVFGHKKWKPQELAYPPNGKTIVAHEKWAMKQDEIKKLKLVKPNSKEGLKVQEKKVKNIERTAFWNSYDKVIITDSCFGRWCPYYIIKNCNYKAVFLGRNKDDVVKSWLESYKAYTKKYSKVKSRELLATRFQYNYFNITDKYTLLHVDKENWKKYSVKEKIGWYYDESLAKWHELKKEIPEKNYFETSYEQITTIEGLTDLSKFIGQPFNYELMKVKVNYNEYL